MKTAIDSACVKQDVFADAAVHGGAGAIGEPRHGDVRFGLYGVPGRVIFARVRRFRDHGYPRCRHNGVDFPASCGSRAGILLDAL